MPAIASKSIVATFLSDLGWFGIAGSEKGLRHLTFGHTSEQQVQDAAECFADEVGLVTHPKWLKNAQKLLVRYATGKPVDLSKIPLDRGSLTDFQSAVFHRVCALEYGETTTYGSMATDAGYPGAARAVGTFMATNPMPLVIPCHRVLAANGKLGGYSAARGVSFKQELLDLEQAGLTC